MGLSRLKKESSEVTKKRDVCEVPRLEWKKTFRKRPNQNVKQPQNVLAGGPGAGVLPVGKQALPDGQTTGGRDGGARQRRSRAKVPSRESRADRESTAWINAAVRQSTSLLASV